jgi:ABC-type glycerol-3-phosphate transport system substrate-binding protein
MRAWIGAVLAVAVMPLLVQCTSRGGDDMTDLTGARLEVVTAWSGVEQQRFEAVLRPFSMRTGVSVQVISAPDRVPQVLAARLEAGHPPDLALLPQPGLLWSLAAAGQLVPLDQRITAEVRRNYSQVWQRLASHDGQLFGVWFKAANKSLIWYNVAAFERAGVVPPSDLAGLLTVGRVLTRSGIPAYAVAAKDGWTLTDWFENLYLRLAGPERYDLLAAHRIPWTDPSVKQTLRLLAKILAPANIAGGVAGARHTGFEHAVQSTFARPPRAAMIAEGDFVAGVINSSTRAELGVDADVFAFPSRANAPPAVVGGGDVAVTLRPSAAATELQRYLATPQAAAIWAAEGGFVSPNLNLDLSVYPDGISRSVARAVLDAGDSFRFDLSDLQPPALGGSEHGGMPSELREFLDHRDVDRTAARLEATASKAHGVRPAVQHAPPIRRAG